MPVPKRKRSKSRRDKRFANKGLEAKQFNKCSNCQEILSGHQACGNCGFYKGKKLFTAKVDRAAKRATAKQEARAKLAKAQESEQEK